MAVAIRTYRQGDLDAAMEDALRLDRISPSGSSMDELAKGLHLLLKGRLDLAVPRWESAVALDPACLPAHQWLALASLEDVGEAESHARILMEADPNVFHLYLLVRILDAQDKHAAIWEAQFDVDAPPEEWYPLTLKQMGEAAAHLGKEKRAERLLNLAEARASGRHLLLDIDVHGARQVREKVPDVVSVFVLPPSEREMIA